MRTNIFAISRAKLTNNLCLFLFFILFSFVSSSSAQQDSTTLVKQESGITVPVESEASIKNMKKTGEAVTKAVKEENRIRQEEIKRDEILGYVYMVLGFSLVLAAAWFLVVASNKRKAKEDEKKRIFLENKVANQPKSGHRSPHKDIHRRGHKR